MRLIISIFITILILQSCSGNSSKPAGETDTVDEHTQHKQMPIEAGYSDSVNSGLIATDTMKGSPVRILNDTVHNVGIQIRYGSPGVKGRIIWGGLVPYNEIWVTGAHHATSVAFDKDVTIDGKIVHKGTYAIFTIPGETEWTFILNRNYQQHLADSFNEKDDILRVTMKPETHPFTARLTYGIEELPGYSGVINILWEKIKIAVPFKTK